LCGLVLCLLNRFKDLSVQPFAADGAIVTLDISVLLGFAWLDVFKSNTVLLSPCHQGPADILWAVVDANGLGFAALQLLVWLEPQVQLLFTVDPVNAFVVPAVSLHVAQIQKAQAKAPCALVLGQPFQPIGDLLVLVAQYWAVAIASLTDLLSGSGLLANHERMEGTTGKCDTGSPLLDCNQGRL
jgi:hypothetical protein